MNKRATIDLGRRGLVLTGFVSALIAGARPGFSQTDGAETLLEVKTADGKVIMFDLAALDSLRQHSFATGTNWSEGVQTFSGPPLAAVLEAAEVPLGPLLATAANDYAANLTVPPLDDLVPIVATRIDGELISRREKGPLWLMFPFDSDPRFRSADVFSQSVWQLVGLSADPADLL